MSDRSVHLLHRPHERADTVPNGTGHASSLSRSDFDWLDARNSEGI